MVGSVLEVIYKFKASMVHVQVPSKFLPEMSCGLRDE